MKLIKAISLDNSSVCLQRNDSNRSFHCYPRHLLHKQTLETTKSYVPLCKFSHTYFTVKTRIYFAFSVIIFLSYLPSLCHSECTFPEHWWGSWFQKGVTDLIYISKYNISEKGICLKNNNEKFIIENRNEKCARCLVISERHHNILQYKETFCYPTYQYSNLLDICSEFNGDAPLFSLFRVNTSPIKCPFKGPYVFSYSKGLMNECKDPLSEIDECTDDKHMLLKFRACTDIPGSESKVEELECIAEWKEAQYRYMVGKMHHSSATTDEDKFRCFVIEKNFTGGIEGYDIGQSGDASCEGLFSPRDGSRTFKIHKAKTIQPSCDFPKWLVENRHWKSLDNRHLYDFSAIKQFSVLNDKKDINRSSKCITYDGSFSLHRINASRFIIHTTLGCKSGYACMQTYLREERIAELQIGNIVSHRSDACSPHHFNQRSTHYVTLTTLDDYTRPCILNGLYSIRSKMPKIYGNKMFHSNYSRLVSLLDSRFMCQEKSLRLKSNCDDQDQFQFICTLDNRVKNFKCRGSWKVNNTQYFLVSFIEKFNYEYCITYNEENNEIRLIRNSHFCYRESSLLDTNHNIFGDTPRYHSFNDDLVSFTLIKEGSCSQRSSYTSLSLNYSLVIAQLLLLLNRTIRVYSILH